MSDTPTDNDTNIEDTNQQKATEKSSLPLSENIPLAESDDAESAENQLTGGSSDIETLIDDTPETSNIPEHLGTDPVPAATIPWGQSTATCCSGSQFWSQRVPTNGLQLVAAPPSSSTETTAAYLSQATCNSWKKKRNTKWLKKVRYIYDFDFLFEKNLSTFDVGSDGYFLGEKGMV